MSGNKVKRITKEALAHKMAKWLEDKYHEGDYCTAYVDATELEDCVIDGPVDLVELSEYILKVIKDET